MRVIIYKKHQPILAVLSALVVLLASAIGVWVLVSFLLPRLPGFWDIKLSAVIGTAVITFFAIYLIFQQTSGQNPGLVIDDDGLTENSNAASLGFIAWDEIYAIREARNIFKHKLIVVVIKNPEIYIERSARLRASRQAQNRQFGSPVIINTHHLKYDSQELVALLKKRAGIL